MTAAAAALLTAEQESAPVTSWGPRLALTVLVLAVVALACWGMWHGWVGRGRRQVGLADPAPLPAEFSPSLLEGCEGRYLATTTAGQWLDRIVAHGLGAPSRATLAVGEAGVLLDREGAPSLFVPTSDLVAVHVDRGIAGAVFEQGGVVVITWRLGGTALDSGFRALRTDDHVAVVAAVQSLLATASPGQPSARTEGETR